MSEDQLELPIIGAGETSQPSATTTPTAATHGIKILTLKRLSMLSWAVLGVLLDETGIPICLTLERPWLNNKKGESCIVKGEHRMLRVQSPHFGDTFQVIAEGRDLILFHKGNIADDSHGCIILGSSFGPVNDKFGLQDSASAFQKFMLCLQGLAECKLIILEV